MLAIKTENVTTTTNITAATASRLNHNLVATYFIATLSYHASCITQLTLC